MTEKQLQQLKKYRKLLRDLVKSATKSRQMKVQHDAYYQKIDFKEEVVLL